MMPFPASPFPFESATDCRFGRLLRAQIKLGSGGANNRNPLRRFGQYVIVLTLEGEAEFVDEHGRMGMLQTGDFLFLFPEIAHAFGPKKGRHWSELFIVMNGPLCDFWRQTGFISPDRSIVKTQKVEYWRNRLAEVFAPHGPDSPSLMERRFMELGLVLADLTRQQTEAQIPLADQDWLSHARGLLEQGTLQRPTLEEIARQLSMSYQTFRKRFSALMRVSPARYRTRCVVMAACERLRDSAEPIKAIAQDLEFADEYHFSKRFKAVMGMAPGEFRRR